eukprot:TRINITY_DN3988_c0_g1_i1.p1 TRINITY_DN3988_c0_g1~~TRINITY_DN3988_c0_g1_i1.p1  ORF type:complete len:322 (+),score=69.85 TRINITY_DN3988_c0_g1_i1:89-967(+)
MTCTANAMVSQTICAFKLAPAYMPVTPLARGMWMFGDVPTEVVQEISSMGAAIASKSAGSTEVGSHCCQCWDRVAPYSIAAANSAGAGYVYDVSTALSSCMSTRPSLDSTTAASALNSTEVGIHRYQSKDENGRVWGMPSAFGKGQCFSCWDKAAPPSNFCVKCQVKQAAAVHPVMSPESMKQMISTFDSLIKGRFTKNSKAASDVKTRLSKLYALIDQGKITYELQVQLLRISEAAAATTTATTAATTTATVSEAVCSKNSEEVGKLCGKIVSEHWQEHKDWLVALRRLLS